jgi:effector-binding domain-containing protein
MPSYEVVLKEAPSMRLASCLVTVPTNDQVPRVLGEAFDAVYAAVRAAGARDAGPCLALWHQPAEVLANERVEAAAHVDRDFAANERVRVYELPACRVASVIHEGTFAEFDQAHAALLSWIEENGYRPLGTYREIYVRDESDGGPGSVTELQYPVERAG